MTGWGEVCPLGPFYLPAYGPGARTGIAEVGQHLIGARPARARRPEPAHGRGAQGPPLREVGDRHGLLGHPGQGRGAARSARCWAAASARRSSSTARSRRRAPRKMAASVARYRSEGYRKFQLKVGGDPDEDIARIRAVRAKLPAGGRAGGRRQHRLADAPGGARGARGGGRGRLHRAALPVVRGVPGRPPAHQPPVRARRDDRLGRRAAARPRRGRHGRDQPQDLQGGRAHEGAPDPRPLRLARHRDDDRGLVGRRHHDRRDRAPRALDARGAALLGDRLQQLRDGQHGRGRAEAQARAGWRPPASRASACARGSRCSAGRSSR